MRSALILGLCSSVALASPLDRFGIGASGTARSLAYVAGADDLYATYYNPAGLMGVKELQFGANLQINGAGLRIDMDQTPAAGREPATPESAQNGSVAFAVPLSGRLAGRAVLGALLEVPQGLLVAARAHDSRRPHWFFYEGYPEVFVVQVALALRLFDGLDLAIGLHNNTGLDGRIELELDPTTNTWSRREMDFRFLGEMAPTLGLKAEAGPIHFGLVFRAPLRLDFATPADMEVEGLDAGMSLGLFGTGHVQPATLGAGLEWRGERLRVEFGAQWKQWSSVPDPSLRAVLDINGEDVDTLGLGDALDAPDGRAQPMESPKFSDVIGFGAALSAKLPWDLGADAGYSFIPSPVPDQLHHTNFVDADRHLLGGALSWRFKDPFDLFAKPLSISAGAQWAQMAERRTEKALGAADPVGSWTAGGHTLSVTFGLRGAL